MSWQTWEDFRLQVFGDPYLVWHDGPDFDGVERHWRADPVEVERLLRLGLAAGDPLAAQAVGQLPLSGASATAFVTILTDTVASTPGGARIRMAEALHRLTGSESWAKEIVAVLAAPDYWSVHLDAAMLLADFAPTPELIAACATGVLDEEYLVRYHSANTLLHYAGRPREVSLDTSLFERVVADGRDQWASASAELAAAATAHLQHDS